MRTSYRLVCNSFINKGYQAIIQCSFEQLSQNYCPINLSFAICFQNKSTKMQCIVEQLAATLSVFFQVLLCTGWNLFIPSSFFSFLHSVFFLLKRDSKSLRYLCAPFTQSFSIDALPQFMCTPKNCFKKDIILLKRDKNPLYWMLSFEVTFTFTSKEIVEFQTVDSTRADSLELRDEIKIQKVYKKCPTVVTTKDQHASCFLDQHFITTIKLMYNSLFFFTCRSPQNFYNLQINQALVQIKAGFARSPNIGAKFK